MPKEIERKFLVKNDAWRAIAVGVPYCQGYLSCDVGATVRVRRVGDRGYLTVKGPTQGVIRLEYEYPIPVAEAEEMLQRLCLRPLIEKVRHKVVLDGVVWEIDEFGGENAGLIVAEVELVTEDHPLTLPEWIGEEVSHDPRYFNANLVSMPYCRW
ncbi:CYTH domain-containing protein [Geitlerinema sp. PCC 7407]|uniref:CYTH domain-containing protein n=1 Tax=Geitlerinema sp. PCC 7407 TaxID=1173025 RepID=UPI00029FF7C1|nr:CYTH domain-containing protein [Geitlerinema sp. PCC 7407]AFY64838.1 adenylate cyclase [Geitlerinema sp. PCC 7407]